MGNLCNSTVSLFVVWKTFIWRLKRNASAALSPIVKPLRIEAPAARLFDSDTLKTISGRTSARRMFSRFMVSENSSVAVNAHHVTNLFQAVRLAGLAEIWRKQSH